MSLAPGTLLGPYRLLALLGQGGMGAVYLAEHVEILHRAAIKVLRADLCDSPDAMRRFKAEAQAVNRIRHEHIVEVTDFGTGPGGEAYFVMELLEGESLAAVLRQVTYLSLGRALHIGIQIADALAASHAVGIVHRDLKPANVFLVRRAGDPDYVKLLDFGIAKLLGEDTSDVHTRTGVPMGTPQYMSPEQCRGQTVDARADIYAFGVMLYQMLTGSLPFVAGNFMGIMVAHISAPFPSAKKMRPELPDAIDDFLAHATAKRPQDRFADMGEVRSELVGLLRGVIAESTQSGEIGPPAAWLTVASLPLTVPPPSLALPRGTPPAATAGGALTGAARPSTVPAEELELEVALEQEDAQRIVALSASCRSIPLLQRAARDLRNLLAFDELILVCQRILALDPRHVAALEMTALALMHRSPHDLEEPTRLLVEASRLAEEAQPELDDSGPTLPPTGDALTPGPGTLAPRAIHEGEALLGRLYKQIWRQAWDRGPSDVPGNRVRAAQARASLLKAVTNYERAQQRMEEAYPGVNVATLYALMAELEPPPLPEAQRARRLERILPLVRERLKGQLARATAEKDRDRREEGLYWAHVSQAELLLATGAPFADILAELDEATTHVGSRRFLLRSTLDQLAMLRALGFREDAVRESSECLEAWL